MFVPPTPGGELAARLKKREAELAGSTGLRIKFVEQGGVKLKNKLVRADPFPSAECGKLKCPVCKMTEFSTPAERGTFWTKCTTKSVGYRIICKNCQKSSKLASYEGETGRPARVRLGEHFAGLKNKTKSNPLHKHQISVHPGENPDWEVKITGTFKNALSRQADEAVRIANLNPSSLINCKSEFNHPPINRVKVHRRSKQK